MRDLRRWLVMLTGAVALASPINGIAATTTNSGVVSDSVTKAAVSIGVPQGSATDLVVPPPLTSVQTLNGDGLSAQSAPAAARIVVTTDGQQLEVNVPANATVGAKRLSMPGVGCIATACGVHFLIDLTVTVRTPQAVSGQPLDVVQPSTDRLAAAQPGPAAGVTLTDEAWIGIGAPGSPGTRAQADADAAQVGAVVEGGIEDLGIFQLRWSTGGATAARLTQLMSMPNVAAAAPATAGVTTVDGYPSDLVGKGPMRTWQFDTIRAPQAWNLSTGSDIPVGVIEPDLVEAAHEDLHVVAQLGDGTAGWHATHVAGLACAEANNGHGLVGAAWGCPIISASFEKTHDALQLDLNTLKSGLDAAKAGAKVVNMSIGWGTDDCTSQAAADKVMETAARYKYFWDSLFGGTWGSDIVWVLAAGNDCVSGVLSPWGLVAAERDNVITVAAINSNQHLASFSDFGPAVEVAAPGGWSMSPLGDETNGVWSTITPDTYGWAVGTSMAAPIVAGVAALVRERHSEFDAAQIGRCITEFAGVGTGSATTRDDTPWSPDHTRAPAVPYSGSIPIVNAEAAVHCAQPTMSLSSYNVEAGDSVTASGSEFSAQENIRLSLDGEAVGETAVADDGSWSTQLVFPPSTPPGAHSLKAVGSFSGNTVLTQVTVTAGSGSGGGSSTVIGAVRLISHTTTGTGIPPSAGQAVCPMWRPRSAQLSFAGPPGLIAGDTSGKSHVYLEDRRTGSLSILDSPADGTTLASGLSDSLFCFDLAWSPDGSKFAFKGNDGGLYVNDLSTGALTQIAPEGDHPAWSPDGSKLAYVSFIDGSDQLVVKDTASGSDTVITRAPDGSLAGGVNFESFGWNADGTELLFDTSFSTTTLTTDGLGGRLVYDFASGSIEHSSDLINGFSPDRRTVAVDRTGGGLSIRNLVTGAETAVDPLADVSDDITGSGRSVLWSPDGRYLAYEAVVPAAGGPGEVLRVFDTATGTFVTAGDVISGTPLDASWSPDGQRIAFGTLDDPSLLPTLSSSGRAFHPTQVVTYSPVDGSYALISSTADGTAASTGAGDVEWSPDGTEVEFVSNAPNLVPAAFPPVGFSYGTQIFSKIVG